MRRKVFTWLFLALMAGAAAAEPPLAGDDPAPSGKLQKAIAALEAESKKAEESSSLLPEISGLAELDEETQEAMFAAIREYYNYQVSGFQHRRQVFAWQLASEWVIFATVIFLVLVGVYFSWLQFRVDLKKSQSGEEVKPAATDFKASAEGLSVSSPVLGVIILVISLAFFYLYLVYVYPIQEIL